jgi:hypothetical protein
VLKDGGRSISRGVVRSRRFEYHLLEDVDISVATTSTESSQDIISRCKMLSFGPLLTSRWVLA